MLAVNLARFGIETSFVDATRPAAFAAAIRPNTRAVFAESLGNPSLVVLDIAAVAEVARAHGPPLRAASSRRWSSPAASVMPLAGRTAGRAGHAVAALHGGLPQGRRTRVLEGLRRRQLRVRVAAVVAAGGIDVPTISHVINYGLSMKAEDYAHPTGRTGRSGRAGLAVTLAERRDAGMVQRIQRFTSQRIPAATIAGLEPRRAAEPAPRPAGRAFGPRKDGRPGFRPAGKPLAKPGPRAR